MAHTRSACLADGQYIVDVLTHDFTVLLSKTLQLMEMYVLIAEQYEYEIK